MDGMQIQAAPAAAPVAAAPKGEQSGQAAAPAAAAAAAVGAQAAAGAGADAPVLKTPEPARIAFDASELRERLQDAVDQLNDQMRQTGRDLRFGIDDRINRQVVTVSSVSSGKVVRQIPDEVVLRVAHSIEDMKGLLFDEIL